MVNVMLVDDHKIIREGIKALLADVPGINFITEADNGEDAIDKFEIYDIDLVIIDVEMPGIDGIETTKRLIENHPDAKVLGFSMHTEESTVEAMINAGAKGYILKNSGKEELIEAMEMVNNNQYFFSSEVSGNLLKDLLNKIKP
jgi:two-component system, NarL family, nitrate/nitrite response regulator NarL